MHFPHLVDQFEDFCHPPSSSLPTQSANNPNNPSSSAGASNVQNPTGNNQDNMVQLPGHFLPFEDIYLPPHLVPVNPEDEDDVVPDMHAAFGINRALGQGHEGAGGAGGAGTPGQTREPAWRDFGLEELVRRGPNEIISGKRVAGAAGVRRNRKDGKRSGPMMMR